jgi:hypothetical protein
MILGPRPATMRQEYRAFIAAGIPESEVAAAIRSRLPIVGSEEFVAAHRDLIEQADPREVTRRDRSIGRPTLADLFNGVRDKQERNLRIREARDRFCYRLSEIAAHVCLHYGSVSRIVSAAVTPPAAGKRSDHGIGNKAGSASPLRGMSETLDQ